MRTIVISIILLSAGSQANAMCFSGGVQSDAADAIKYLACVIDEQNSKIEDLTSKISDLERKIDNLEYEVGKLDR